ncbi:MAG TPA: GNAT family N-acetyltransferase [Solirubrobacteraceae bacterium]|nr:GNAT family N-acetyltransferase [Solirubrobacteraceae bacterium]
MVERHNGVFGGCWCTWFHRPAGDAPGVAGLGQGYQSNRAIKERLVRAGRSHAALVFDGEQVVAWCQFGAPDELPNIYHRKQYLEEARRLPDFRITCIFVDKRYRRRGLSAIALRGAIELIAAAGGGVVEGYPHDTQGRRQSVLYSGTRTLFEQAGFVHDRPKGAKNTVMVKTVAACSPPQAHSPSDAAVAKKKAM